MDFEVHVREVKRREWVKSRSQALRKGGASSMRTEEHQAPGG